MKTGEEWKEREKQYGVSSQGWLNKVGVGALWILESQEDFE
jgi:hypothetical protein